jgi:4-carboxymuconolactone decarboxylase
MKRNNELFDLGMKVRREVLTPEFVDAAYAGTDDFTRDIQDYVTEHAWGTVWARPGLDRRIRSLITISILAALGIEAELSRHVSAAIRNGCSAEEIKEAFLQTAVYAGAPRAVDAFRVAKPIVASHSTS